MNETTSWLCTLAVDLGGTKVEAALVRGGTVLAGTRHRTPTGRAADAAALTAAVEDVVRRTLASRPAAARIDGAGIGSAGPVDRHAGTISPLNLPVADFPLAAVVSETLREVVREDVPVTLALDGTCIALAEARHGAARDVASSVSMVVSTGVGGGIVLNGDVVPGDSGNAGHVGQLRLSATAPVDSAREDTVEEIASGPASVRWAQAQGWTGETGEDLSRDAAAGDGLARAAIVRSATAVGQGIASMGALLDVRRYVIGGGFSFVSDDYVQLVQDAARAAAVLPASHVTEVVRAELGGDAPLVGAACLATP
ncbi:ROK family protein [Microbacterium xanthum]|uniref:ROK family protein n=1 Tax=Microbacterium xanthum TaxID=3079794 RepID=UPI002AD5A0E2|nr:ROK family protein [Microbacterium sp. KSW-48]MDZ8171668.1 ROK family protein [Microbacterium sp. KSW-48]